MIKALQEANLKKNVSDEECIQEGFVTAEYTVEFLEEMHSFCPSIIAKNEVGEVIGYALVTTRDVHGLHDLLTDLLDSVYPLVYNNKTLEESSFVLVGQLCVEKTYRGQGLVKKMYDFFRDSLRSQFDYVITDVASTNPRSLRAHLGAGFQIIHTIPYGGQEWKIILQDWTQVL